MARGGRRLSCTQVARSRTRSTVTPGGGAIRRPRSTRRWTRGLGREGRAVARHPVGVQGGLPVQGGRGAGEDGCPLALGAGGRPEWLTYTRGCTATSSRGHADVVRRCRRHRVPPAGAATPHRPARSRRARPAVSRSLDRALWAFHRRIARGIGQSRGLRERSVDEGRRRWSRTTLGPSPQAPQLSDVRQRGRPLARQAPPPWRWVFAARAGRVAPGGAWTLGGVGARPSRGRRRPRPGRRPLWG